MTIVKVEYSSRASFEQAAEEAGGQDPALLADLSTSWFYIAEPRLTDLPDFFGPFFTAIAIAHLREPGRELSVLDYGGTIGRYRDYVTAMFSNSIRTRWSVVETPLYVDHARSHGAADIRFSTTIEEAGGPFNFVLFSGVLQCMADWKAPLRNAAVQGADYIFVTRTPLADEERPFLQTVTYSDKVVRQPGRAIRRSDMIGQLNATHSLFASWTLSQHLGEMGVCDAPAMLWRRLDQ